MTDTSTGGGFHNIISGIEHIPAHIEAWIAGESELSPQVKAVLALIPKTIAKLAAEAAAVGLPVLEKAGATIAENVAGVLTGAESKGAAGSAVIADVKATGTALLDDTLHILTTEALTDVTAVETALTPPTPATETPAA
ncbi:hypothetical protein [Rhodopila sp.]|uniref:hypothetical protein n=1 Tax=Rhodopila sp. TaxID=2480087 RepID=UPI003D14C631